MHWDYKIFHHLIIWNPRIRDHLTENSIISNKRWQLTIRINFFHRLKKEGTRMEERMELRIVHPCTLLMQPKHQVARSDTIQLFKIHMVQGKSTKCHKEIQLSSEVAKMLLLTTWSSETRSSNEKSNRFYFIKKFMKPQENN